VSSNLRRVLVRLSPNASEAEDGVCPPRAAALAIGEAGSAVVDGAAVACDEHHGPNDALLLQSPIQRLVDTVFYWARRVAPHSPRI
jgi:hypothetical protein